MNDEEVLGEIAEELRRVADALEDDDLRLTEAPRFTYVVGDVPEIEVRYVDPKNGGERTVEVRR